MMTIGYAGALDPSLKVGDLVIPSQASLFGVDSRRLPLDELEFSGSWKPLRNERLREAAARAGLSAYGGSLITSPYIIGDPLQKKSLYRRFGATAIDMESGSLARVAETRGIPYACARAISDDANDEFLAPLSYDPGSNPLNRALKVVSAGNWLKRYQDWKYRAAIARGTLRQFLSCYLQRLG
jgi:nucleoside phosphorylase